MEALHTEYGYAIEDVAGGLKIHLSQLSSGKVHTFFLAGGHSHAQISAHMNSLTDDLCGDWFREAMSKEEQKAFKLAKKEERRRIEAAAKAEEERVAALKKAEKEEEKARKRERFLKG